MHNVDHQKQHVAYVCALSTTSTHKNQEMTLMTWETKMKNSAHDKIHTHAAYWL